MAGLSFFLPALFLAVLSACAHPFNGGKSLPLVAVGELIARPEMWDGKRVRVAGWPVRDLENYNLFANRAVACGDVLRSKGIGADWEHSHLPYRHMRSGVFKGTFQNQFGVVQPDGSLVISISNLGPGPLEDIKVIAWSSGLAIACRMPLISR